jgi:very-short-patch-repair endonuclease
MKQSQEILRRSQSLRRNMTKEERRLWYDFLKEYPVQFKRQVPFGNYIVDFHCFRAKLVVELDGSQHCEPEEIAYDQKRTEYLESLSLSVLLISNLDVIRNFAGVCEGIDLAIKSRLG